MCEAEAGTGLRMKAGLDGERGRQNGGRDRRGAVARVRVLDEDEAARKERGQGSTGGRLALGGARLGQESSGWSRGWV